MRQFNIKKGRHHCNYWWTKLFRLRWNHKKWNVVFILSDNCYWTPPRNDDDGDINKLYGCGFGFNHHKNSWRIGWVPVFNKENYLNLYAYVYDEAERGHISRLIGEVKVNRPYAVTVEIVDDKYRFTCLDLGVFIDMPNVNKDCKLQFDLYFYAGGNNPAIHDMTCFVDFNPL